MAKVDDLYDQDFFRWTKEQATALRRAKSSNLPLDWEKLAEEIESLGKSDRRDLASQIRHILRHLLRLEASPAMDPRAGWRSTIIDARSEIGEVLRDSPSLRRQVDGLIREQSDQAAALASADLAQYSELADTVRVRLKEVTFTAEQVVGDWFPEPPVALSAHR